MLLIQFTSVHSRRARRERKKYQTLRRKTSMPIQQSILFEFLPDLWVKNNLEFTMSHLFLILPLKHIIYSEINKNPNLMP